MKIQDPTRLSGLQKVAIIMLSSSDENVRKLFEQMSSEEIRAITRAMSNLGSVSSDVVSFVLDEFNSSFGAETMIFGNVKNTQTILERALSKDKADKIMDEIIGPQGRNTWEKLGNVNEAWLTLYIQNEHPQTAALIISKLLPDCAARVLSNLNEAFAREVLIRMLNIGSVKGEIIERVEDILRSEFIANMGKTHDKNSLETIAEIFNSLDKTYESKYMSMLEASAADAAKKIKDLMFTFEDILNLTSKSVQKLIRAVDKQKLLIALKGASDDVRNFFFSNMSQRAVRLMADEMNEMGLVKVRDVLDSQALIIKRIKELVASGDIEIISNDKDEYVR